MESEQMDYSTKGVLYERTIVLISAGLLQHKESSNSITECCGGWYFG